MTSLMDPLGVPTPAPPQLGELVPLGHCVVKLDVSAETTMPDTPNGYTAALKVMADQGDLDKAALQGPQGPPGQIGFQVREVVDPTVNSEADLVPLPNNPDYIGRYYVLQDLNDQGQVIGQTMYIWYGTAYRRMMMGSFGPPGPVPAITPIVDLIPPYDESNNPNKSFVNTSGPRLSPTWEFELAAPAGQCGQTTPIFDFPDVDEITAAPVNGDLMMFTGRYTAAGQEVWAPGGIGAQLPTTWSMPEGSFASYSGVAQQVGVGSFQIPPQPYPWTPIVWGHLGGTDTTQVASSNAQQLLKVTALGGTFTLSVGGATTPPIPYNADPATIEGFLENLVTVGVNNINATLQGAANTLLEFVNTLGAQVIAPIVTDITNLIPPDLSSAVIGIIDSGGNLINDVLEFITGDPFRIGAQVLLGDPTQGIQVARGIGNTLGRINIYPHYSSSANNQNNRNRSLTPTNGYAVVPANHTDPAMGTLYTNLWNDGQIGVYDFNPSAAQLFVMVQPMGPIAKPPQGVAYPLFSGEGFLQATAQRVVP
ncbi:MAG TPA: hypothetical protein VMS84_07535 [Mycobacterium sp.]|nr:hypothetical protein [Mycobacterium sp.]